MQQTATASVCSLRRLFYRNGISHLNKVLVYGRLNPLIKFFSSSRLHLAFLFCQLRSPRSLQHSLSSERCPTRSHYARRGSDCSMTKMMRSKGKRWEPTGPRGSLVSKFFEHNTKSLRLCGIKPMAYSANISSVALPFHFISWNALI